MPDFTVGQYGTDVYGRPVLMTAFMYAWYEEYCGRLGFRPAVAQGAWMSRLGGGADASDGAHDKGKCLDLRTIDRTGREVDLMVRTAREMGAGAYRRDETPRHGGMTPHMHLTLGCDADGSPMADVLWASYVSGGDGLYGPLDDYEWRPTPLVLTWEEDEVTPEQEDRIAEKAADKTVAKLMAYRPGGDATTVKQIFNRVKTYIGRQK